MKSFYRMTLSEIKLFLREPMNMFFTLAFPLILLFVFGAIFGNEPAELFGGMGTVDVSVPAYIGMTIATLGLLGLPIGLATYREQGILRRMRATPVRPVVIFGALLTVNLIAALAGTVLLLVAGRLVFNLKMPEMPLSLLPAIFLCMLSFSAFSFVLAGLVSTPRVAQALGMAILMPMLFLSGAAMPRETMPENIRRIGDFLPLTYVVELLKGLWFGQGWNMGAVAVLLGMLVVGTLLATRTFRWE